MQCRGRPAILASAGSLFAVSVSVSVSGCGSSVVDAFSPEGSISRVVVDVDAGSVELVPASALRVERTVRGSRRNLRLSHRLEDEVLTLEGRCVTLLPCALDVRVDLPSGVGAAVDLGDGEVWATAVPELDLRLGSGTANLDVLGRLTAQVGAGALEASLASDAHARVTVGRGDITLRVPAGPWRLDVAAQDLVIHGVQPDEQAMGTLELVAPAGTARVVGSHPIASN